ncbi:uncharacterized protein JCM15063_003298 [Sporobolomyces koalae]|uniref:uncharacterized protein n=1 Tax=Sporobolomyces koalae TaxID=500713 RepID=UPI003171EF96
MGAIDDVVVVEELSPSAMHSARHAVSASPSRSTLTSHPYSTSANQGSRSSVSLETIETIDTHEERHKRLLRELDRIPYAVARDVFDKPLAPPPAAVVLDNAPTRRLSISYTPHPLSPYVTDDVVPPPRRSLTRLPSTSSMRFDPTRDLSSAYALYPRDSPGDSQDSIAPFPRMSDTRLDRPPSPSLRTVTPTTFSFDEDAKARALEKKLGRQKLKWWGLFWLVVIGGTALGIGIAAATKSNEASGDHNTARR